MNTIERILVPVDFSECSRAAVRAAVGLAARYGAEVELLHVHDAPWTPEAVTVRTEDGREVAAEQYLEEESQRQLTELAASVPELARIAHRKSIRTGMSHDIILNRARAAGADLIVMGTHGRTGLSHLLMGSVAEKVLRGAPCPVLVVRDEYPS